MEEKLKVPAGVTAVLAQNVVKVKGAKGEVEVPFTKKLTVKLEGGTIMLTGTKMLVNAVASHLNNAFSGVQETHKKKMKMVFAHFPMKIEVKGSKILVKNFLGGKRDMYADIVGPTKVVVKGQDIELEGPDAYAVGQTAANLRQVTRVKGKDVRVFQDGIYVVKQ